MSFCTVYPDLLYFMLGVRVESSSDQTNDHNPVVCQVCQEKKQMYSQTRMIRKS